MRRILAVSTITVLLIGGSALWKISDIREQAIRQTDENRPRIEDATKDHEQLRKIALALGVKAVSDDLATIAETVLKERNGLKAANTELEQRYKRLDVAHTDLSGKHQRLSAEKVHFERKVRDAVSKHSHSISSHLARNSSRQVVTAPGKSIPFYGIALITGLAVLDIYEACEMIKELNELNIEIGTQPEKENAEKICGLNAPSPDQIASQLSANWQAAYSSAASAANQAGRSLTVTPPTVDASQLSRQACSIFKGLWFC